MTLYGSKARNLTFLRKKAQAIDVRLSDVWPRETTSERRYLELLREAYVQARDSRHDEISREGLDWVTERVELLRGQTTAVCQERLTQLRDEAATEARLVSR